MTICGFVSLTLSLLFIQSWSWKQNGARKGPTNMWCNTESPVLSRIPSNSPLGILSQASSMTQSVCQSVGPPLSPDSNISSFVQTCTLWHFPKVSSSVNISFTFGWIVMQIRTHLSGGYRGLWPNIGKTTEILITFNYNLHSNWHWMQSMHHAKLKHITIPNKQQRLCAC